MVTRFRLGGFYLLFFLSVGVTLPFLPAYFQTLGLSASQIGVLLSVGPVFSMVMPPFWGQVADRTGRPGAVLLALCAGYVVGFGVLLWAQGFVTALVAMALCAAFSTSVTTVVDALTLAHLATHGGAYAHVRRWGSLGFVASTLAFGFAIERVDQRALYVASAFLVAAALWAGLMLARAPRASARGARPTIKGALGLLKNKSLVVLLLATMLHWVAGTPYHGSLSPHYLALGLSPWAISVTAAVAVFSEVVVLTLWPKWSQTVSARALLIMTFMVSALRWWGMAATSDVRVLTLLAGLHGLTFGAFYVSAVAQVDLHTPPSLRATGQALFVAVTFGVGGLVGFSGSGALYDLVGGHALFAIAGAVEFLPVAALVWLQPRAQQAPQISAGNGA